MTVIDLLNQKYKGKNVSITGCDYRDTERNGILTDFHVGSASFDQTEDMILFRLNGSYDASYMLNIRSEISINE